MEPWFRPRSNHGILGSNKYYRAESSLQFTLWSLTMWIIEFQYMKVLTKQVIIQTDSQLMIAMIHIKWSYRAGDLWFNFKIIRKATMWFDSKITSWYDHTLSTTVSRPQCWLWLQLMPLPQSHAQRHRTEPVTVLSITSRWDFAVRHCAQNWQMVNSAWSV